jgi:hypothetical protein
MAYSIWKFQLNLSSKKVLKKMHAILDGCTCPSDRLNKPYREVSAKIPLPGRMTVDCEPVVAVPKAPEDGNVTENEFSARLYFC